MPTVKKNPSALKRARQAEKRRLRNRAVRSKVKTLAKNVLAATENNDKAQVERTLKEAVRAISSARSKGVLHRNTASRAISKLAKRAAAALRPAAA